MEEQAVQTAWEEGSLGELLRPEGFACPCGKVHKTALRFADIGRGVLSRLPERVRQLGGRTVQMYCDGNTYHAAGARAEALLSKAGIACHTYCFPEARVTAEAAPVGQAAMHFAHAADVIIGVGGGTINDICKILAGLTGRPYLIVGTAPSMDGFASDTSSMVVDGLKSSLPTAGARAILGDTDILAAAPGELLAAGLGDMLAKYISLAEWRISAEVNGEYFCPHVANLVRRSLDKCAAAAEGLSRRDPDAVGCVMEGLVLSGLAMGFAGVTRPASGMEHYFSHIWDMRALAFDRPEHLHGEQVGVATLLCLQIYEKLCTIRPDQEAALAAVQAFRWEDWCSRLRAFLGGGAEAMIALEAREGKYDKAAHARRLEVILQKWPRILEILQELPRAEKLQALLQVVGGKTTPAELGLTAAEVAETFRMTKDIRDKYVGSRLLWDLGLLEQFARDLAAENA